jgi:PAS domain S-box-containing protein
MARVLEGAKLRPAEREIIVEREDGSRRNVIVTPTAFKDSSGAIVGSIKCIHDITERKKAETELSEKKKELDLVLKTTPFMLTRCSRDLRYQYVSNEYGKLIGRSPDKVAGKLMVQIIGKKAFAVIQPFIKRVLAGERLDWEAEVPFKNGNRFLRASYLPERNHNGQIVGWIASLLDITGRKRSEELLAEAARQQLGLYHFVRQRHEAKTLEEIYSAALNAILGILRCDRASILLFDATNKMRFVAWRGLSATYRMAVEGHSPWQRSQANPQPICVEDMRHAQLPSGLKKTIREEGIHAAAFIPLVRDGRVIGKFMTYYNAPHSFTDLEVTLSLNIAGQLALAVERKHAEADLLESEQFHRAFFSQSEVGMTRSDLQGRMTSVNKKLCEIVGYSESELIGRTILDLTHPDYQKETYRLHRALVNKGAPYHLEKRYVRKDGSAVWVNVTASPVRDANGKTQAAVGVIRDITQRKEAQLALENAKQSLEKRVQVRTRELMAANQQLVKEIDRRKSLEGEILEVSEREQRHIGQELHDSLCQHLTAIAFMARSTALKLRQERKVEGSDLEKIAELINEGVTEARTIARGLHPVEMNPDGFTAAMETLLHRRSQIPYRLEIDEKASIPDATVALHLFRIASEAVINANKHARAHELVVRMRASEKQIELTVTDDGIGLKKKDESGTGMGFHVMDYRARSIGARLEITSLKPHGTRVACYLPRG